MSLDNLLSKWEKGIITASLTLSLAVAVGSRYSRWKKEPVYREDKKVVAPRDYDFDNITEANRLLLEFPISIPGAAKIERYITPGAKYCLVHIRQMHLSNESTEKDKEKTALIQSDIYNILLSLADKKIINSVYVEGATPEDADALNKLAASDRSYNEIRLLASDLSEVDMIKEKIQSMDIVISGIENGRTPEGQSLDPVVVHLNTEVAKLKSQLPAAENRDKEDRMKQEAILSKRHERYKYSVTDRLDAEGKIIVYGAEDPNRFSVSPKDYDNFVRIVMDKREDYLLRIIPARNQPLAVTVFGAAHAWGGPELCGASYSLEDRYSFKDNITEWNRAHPTEKFSLIEIKPIHYTGLSKTL
jgi:hypothetical protein